MSNNIPNPIKIYHIVHLDKLPHIIQADGLWCDAVISFQPCAFGTTIGMQHIKERRKINPITTCTNLMVGQCVPFYFCPRSVMLYYIHINKDTLDNSELSYKGGQTPIVHLVADMYRTIQWANQHRRQWAFTTGNAGAWYFDSYVDLSQLNQIDWNAVNATYWKECKNGKQAEFLIENNFPWMLVEEIGVYSSTEQQQVQQILLNAPQVPRINVHREWYY